MMRLLAISITSSWWKIYKINDVCSNIVFFPKNYNVQSNLVFSLSRRDLFQLRSNQSRGHRFKIHKQFSSSNTRPSFFTQRVINVWNSLPTSVEFGSLSAFTKSNGRVNLNQFIPNCLQIPPCVLMGVMHSVCIFVFTVGLVYICGYCIRKITMLLDRSDVSAGNSLSVPQLTAVRCHYPVFLFSSPPFLI